MIGALYAGLVVQALVGAPTIDEVVPAPLPRDATAEIRGAGFVAGDTTVTIGALAQSVVVVESTSVRFIVAAGTPLGEQSLIVTAAGESDLATVMIVAPLPTIDMVTPSPLVLGARASLQGERLAAVDAVTLDGVACDVVAQSDAVLAFDVPFEAALLGRARLELGSPSGPVAVEVDVVAPAPTIATITPNPARAGDLVTIRGRIVMQAPEVRVGDVVAPLVMAAADAADPDGLALTVWLPTTVAPGQQSVVVSAAGIQSSPAGPLIVQAAAADRPTVRAVYPARVAAGGALWVIGDDLDTIDRVLPGLTLESCDARACRLSSSGLAAGPPFTAAIAGSAGAALIQVELVDEVPEPVVVTGVEPSPARRGEPLTIRADNVVAVRSVVLGGQAQVIEFFDAERMIVTVHPSTPLGAETLFVASNVGSEAVTVTVLDPVVEPVVEPGPEAPAEADDAGDVVERTRRDDDGCAGAGASAPITLAMLVMGVVVSRRRRAT